MTSRSWGYLVLMNLDDFLDLAFHLFSFIHYSRYFLIRIFKDRDGDTRGFLELCVEFLLFFGFNLKLCA